MSKFNWEITQKREDGQSKEEGKEEITNQTIQILNYRDLKRYIQPIDFVIKTFVM